MKTFLELREDTRVLKEKTVFNKKINGVPVKLVKSNKGIVAYVDGDQLDTFKDEKEALETAKTVIKEL